jgi:DNA primase
VPDFAQTVKQQADIVKVIETYIRLRKAGAQNYQGLCPFHKEKSPSFSVHAVRQFYHCFGCQASGDVFSFVGKIENVGFPEAVRIVAQKCGIPLPKREFSSPEQAAESRQRTKLLELHETAAAWFEEQLRSPEGALAREYLAGRGLTPEGIKTFRIGYAPDSYNTLRDRLSGMADNEALRASGLFASKEQGDGSLGPIYDRFRKRVMFPICNESGRVIAFTARTLEAGDKAGAKYINSPETPLYSKGSVLFNLDKARTAIRQLEYALLVEGQMDCISVFLRGIQNVIATSGTAFTEQQVAILRRHTSQVVVNFDPDAAGSNAAEKSIALLTEEGFNIKIVTLDGGLDPDRYIRERGVEAYTQALRGARRQADYLIERARQMFPGASSEQKVKAMNYLLPHIRRMPEELARLQFEADAAQKLGIDSEVLRKKLREAALKRRDRVEGPAQGTLLPFERFFIEAACNDAKDSSDYEELHRELQSFDLRMKDKLNSADWQAHVLPNLPSGLFDQLVSRRQGASIEATATTADLRAFLMRIFSESSRYPRMHKQDLAIIKDLEVEAMKWAILVKRMSVDFARKSGELERSVQLSQEILELEKNLRKVEDEEQS